MVSGTTNLFLGTSGDDYYQYTGTEYRWSAYGGDGNDYLIGGNGGDYISGENNNDTLYGGNGDDYLDGGNNNDTLYGGAGNDTLIGCNEHPSNNRDGNNYLYGGDGNDYLYGGDNGNYLDGGLGADLMGGGNGNDIYIVDNPYDSLSENNYNFNGGIDTVYSSVSYGIYSIQSGGVENLYLTGTTAIYGSGNSNSNFISGNSANNILYGYQSYDTLVGGEGNDILVGYGNGIETDSLSGGVGADTFVLGVQEAFYLGSGHAVINDFRRQEGDKFQVIGSISDYSLDKSLNFTGTTALDTGIYYQGDLIAVVQDTRKVSLFLDFIFPNL